MTISLIQVDWAGRDVSGSTTTFTFDDIESISIRKEIEAKASSATIKLKNPYDRIKSGFSQPFAKYVSDTNDILFKEGDTVKIFAAQIDSFRALDTSNTSSDLLMTGEIAEVTVRGEPKSAKVTLKIVDKTYVMLNRLHTFPYTADLNLNAPEIIQRVVRAVTDNVESDSLSYDSSGNQVSNGIYSVDARLETSGGFIEDARIDASVFPDLSMAKVAKPAYDWIRDLSTLESTNDFAGADDEDAPTQDRNMVFYIDELNRFHWFYPHDAATTTLDGAITDSDTTISLTDASDFPSTGVVFIGTERISYTGKSTNDLTGCTRGENNTTAASHSDGDTVKNAITITEGDTSSGFTLLNYKLTKKTFDVVNFIIFSAGTDMVGNGISNYYFHRETKSKSLKDKFKAYNDIAAQLFIEEINEGNITQDNTTSSAFTFNGNRYKETTGDYDSGSGITTSWGATVTSDNDYNDEFRTECIRQAKMRARALCGRRGSPRWKGSMEFKFAKFIPGDIIEFTSTRGGLNGVTLRIKKVTYQFTKTSMFSTIDVEEDEDKLSPS